MMRHQQEPATRTLSEVLTMRGKKKKKRGGQKVISVIVYKIVPAVNWYNST